MPDGLPALDLAAVDCARLMQTVAAADWQSASPSDTSHGPVDSELQDTLASLVNERGAALVRMPSLTNSAPNEAASAVTAIASAIAYPIRVFQYHPGVWRYLEVDTSRPADRSGGTGTQPLHIDFVNASFPPDFVFLYCQRPDPHGGGASLIARTVGVAHDLPDWARAVLERRIFRDGEVRDLENVGSNINPFAVLDGGHAALRYTAKLVDATTDQQARAALRLLRDCLNSRIIDVMLNAGDLLIIDQRQTLHGRRPLGADQEAISSPSRRLLMHGFGRSRTNHAAGGVA
jgi:alpha-ketoglutarate-dependent taurine dioxygenase